MTMYMYLATAIGMFVAAQNDGNWRVARHTLTDQPLTSIAVTGRTILAGTKNGLLRSTDQGDTWQNTGKNLSIPYMRWLAALPDEAGIILAGTEPAGIFVSRDAGRTWKQSPEVFRLRDQNGWFLPYSSGAGCVRGFAASASGRVYAAVEVGGVLISEDGGNSWRLVEGSDGKPDIYRRLGSQIHPDVHSITVHPTSPDIVTAATGGGLYRSTDAGGTWKSIYRCYIRAVWVDPADPRHMIAGPADGVSRNGRIEETTDGGKTWHPAGKGTRAPWPEHMVERFARSDRHLFAVLSNGELWIRRIDRNDWRRMLPEIKQIKAVAFGS